MPGQQALSPFHTRTFLLRSYDGGKGKKAACFLLSTCRQTFDVEADDSLPPKALVRGHVLFAAGATLGRATFSAYDTRCPRKARPYIKSDRHGQFF